MLLTPRCRFETQTSKRCNRPSAIACALVALVVLAVACSANVSSERADGFPWPTEGWAQSAPIDQCVSIEGLRSFGGASSRYIDSVLVVRNGYIIYEQNSSSFADGSKHFLFSTTKSILSILIGVAIDKGFIESVDQPILDFFPNQPILNRSEKKEALTLEHLLTMTSGFECPEDGNETYNRMATSWNWTQFALDLPVTGVPGETYQYCNANSHLLSCILTAATGLTALEFAHEHLFGPLGIVDVLWNTDPQGNSIGCTGLWMTPRDLAKLGLLFLQEGVWGGEQIVSPSWVAESVLPHTTSNDYGYRNGYGYQWWIGAESDGWYMTSGYQGQHLFVLPDEETVVVFTGSYDSGNNQTYERLVRSYLLRALDATSLEQESDALAEAEASLVPALPSTAADISGRRIVLGPHSYLFESITLSFDDSSPEAAFQFRRYGLDYEFKVGLDNVWRINAAMGPSVMQYRAMRGRWLDEHTFQMDEIDLDWGETWELTLTFEEDRVGVVFASLPTTNGLRFETVGRFEPAELP